MSTPRRARLNVFLDHAHANQLRELATIKHLSQSSIVATALSSFLSADDRERRDTVYLRRLDRLASQFERLERDQTILIESLALFIRYELSVSSAIPEQQQDSVRAQGKARFEKFIEQLARHLQRGGSLVKDLHDTLNPESTHKPLQPDHASTMHEEVSA